MVSKSELKIIGVEEVFGETRYRVCVQGTNILVNVRASSQDEALIKALEILAEIGVDDETLDKLREIVGKNTKC